MITGDRSRQIKSPLGQGALRGILVGVLLGMPLGFASVAASAITHPELRNSAFEMLILAVAAAAVSLGLLGGFCGLLVTSYLILRGRPVIPHRLSALFLTAASAVLPVGLALSTVSTLQTRQRNVDISTLLMLEAVAGLAALAVGLTIAMLTRRHIGKFTSRLGVWEQRIVNIGSPTLMLTFLLLLAVPILSSSTQPSMVSRPSNVPVVQRPLPSAALVGNPPNVLLITVDSLRADRLGSYGSTTVRTPHLDRLAADGARFEWAFIQQPQTNAQHASLFTGAYPSTHGVRAHMVDRLPERFPTLAELLQNAGYRTAGIFSWVSLEPAFSGLQRGFDSYQGYVLNRPDALADGRMQFLASAYRRLTEYLAVVKTADLVLKVGQGLEDRIDGRADVTTDAAIEWLRQGDRPFFLWVHYFDPHYPYAPPEPYDRTYDPEYDGNLDGSMTTIRRIYEGTVISDRDLQHLMALYDGEVTFSDAQIGRLLATLDESGLASNTIVVVMADHGEGFTEHNYWFHGATLYNNEVRVPLLIRYPTAIAPGTVVSAPVQGVDIKPTILEMVGLPVPESVQGSSLVPLLQNADNGAEREAFSQLADDRVVAIVRGGWKLILERDSRRIELYDLASDPDETEDLAAKNPALVRDLENRLRIWMSAQGIEP